MLPAGERQPEVVKPMLERLAGDGNAKITHVGKVGQAEPARYLLLSEDHVLVRPVQCFPLPNATLHRSPRGAEFGMATDHLIKDGDRAQLRGRLEQRHNFALPTAGERIGPTPLAWLVFL